MIWLAHMKTTVEIAEDLFAQAAEVARREGITLRALFEEGLRAALAQRARQTPYRWPDLSVDGEGLAPDVAARAWEPLRDLIYTRHGA
jgi:hypothetical protein